MSGQELFRSLAGLVLIIFDIGYVDLVRSGRVLRLRLQKLFHTYGFILVRFLIDSTIILMVHKSK